MDEAVDAQKLDIFVLNCQPFRTKIQHFASSAHQTSKTKLLHIPPVMAVLILAQQNIQPTFLWH
jgi:hypothetical protein